MSSQLLSKHAPPQTSDTITDSTPPNSSFEHFEPGLQFLTNDPLAKDRRHILSHQQQQHLHHPPQPENTNTTIPKLPSEDSNFIDLLYIPTPTGSVKVMNITSSASPKLSAPTDLYASPPEHDDPSQPALLPPLSAAVINSAPESTTPHTIIAGSGSARALLGPELDLEEANELDYEAKLMSWWPWPEADELKIERM